MADVGFSSSTAGAAAVAASGMTRVQAPQMDSAAQSNASAARNIADSVALSVEAMQAAAVTAAQKAGNSNTKNVQQSPEAGQTTDRAQLTSNIENALSKMSGDVGTLMRMFGLNSQEASEVQTKFSHRIAERVGQPPEASLGLRAFVPYYSGDLMLEARKIDIAVQQGVAGEFDFSVDFGSIGVVTSGQSVASPTNGQPTQTYTTPDGVNLSVTPDSNGVVLDQSGQGMREISSVLTGQTTLVTRDKAPEGSSVDTAEDGARANLVPGLPAGDPSVDRFGQAQGMDRNRDGKADQQDSGFESLLVIRSGSATPMVEGGAVRVQFDAVIPIQDRHDFATIQAAEQATAPSERRVKEAPAGGYDVQV